MDYAVDNGIGEPRERHLRWIDDVLLCLPLRGKSLGQGAPRRGKDRPCGRAHLAAIERDAELVGGMLDRGARIKTAAQLRPHPTPGCRGRVERSAGENAFEQ